MKNKNLTKQAFTLVELIVVITILTVLATVAFISFQWYTGTSRDSVRLSDMANIEKWLNMKTSIAKKLPYPDDKISITASGTLLNYQWYAWVSVLGNIEVHWWGIDPLDQSYYTYSINDRRNKYQVLWYLEDKWEISFTQNTYADLNNRYPINKWSELWILVDSVTKEPIHGSGSDVDIINTNYEYSVYLNNTEWWVITWSGNTLTKKLDYIINKNWNCNSILRNWNSTWNWNYKVNPTWNNEFEVYCDMESHDGWWTLVWHWLPTEARFNDTTHESLAISWDIMFNQIFADSVHTTDYHIEKTSDTAVLEKTIREYFNEVSLIADALSPVINFHDINWIQNITIPNMFYGYWKIFRIFAIGRNTWTIDRIYVCNSYDSTKFTTLPTNDRIELWGVNGWNCYFLDWARDNIVHWTETWVSMYKWQEMKIYVK